MRRLAPDSRRMKRSAFLKRLGELEGSQRMSLLCRFAFNCSIAARGAYIEAGCSPDDAARQLRGYNEILLIANSELDAALNGSARTRSALDLASAVEHWITIAGIDSGMEYACKRTAEETYP
jgi:hypothetical protein